jgi:hypothetical protein
MPEGAHRGLIVASHQLSNGVHALLSHETMWEFAVVALPPHLIYVVPVLVMDSPAHFPVLRRKSQISLIKIKKIRCNRPPKKPKDGG